MIWSADIVRCERGFKRMIMRPWLEDALGPPAPIEDIISSTFGSCRTIAATCCWWAAIAAKDVPSAVSVLALMRPVSSLGMKPFGTNRNRATVPTRMPSESSMAMGR